MRGAAALVVLMLGLFATLLSGFYGRNYGTAGRTDIRYGVPFNWHGEQGYDSPNSSAGWFSWQNFVYDVAAWSILFGIVALAFSNRRRRSPHQPQETTDTAEHQHS